MPQLREFEPRFEPDSEPVQRRASITNGRTRRRRSWGAWFISVATVLSLVLCAGVGYLLWEQMRPIAAIVDTAQAPPAAPAGATSLATAAPSAAPPRVEQLKDWFVVCPADGATVASCHIEQQLFAKDSKIIVFAWIVRRDAEGVIHAVWRMPSDVVTDRGMTMDIGDGTPRGVPFASCNKDGCLVQAILAPDYLRKLETAASISAIVIPTSTGKPVKFGLSSKGFVEALARLAPTK